MAAKRHSRLTPGYIAVLAAAFVISVAAGWLPLATRMDREAYDAMTRSEPPPPRTPESVVVAIDERTITETGGMRKIRTTLASALHSIAVARPAVVAIDIILSEPGDRDEDERLAAALREVPNVILASDLVPDTGAWENPLTAFREVAKAVGHVHAAPNPVSRVIPLELVSGHDRRWAMALEAARLKLGATITESPRDIDFGGTLIPANRQDSRLMYIRYREGVPVISMAAILKNPRAAEPLRAKAVFIGATAQTVARDRLMTPLDRMMSGVEIHSQAFETILGRDFLTPASLTLVLVVCLMFVTISGAAFSALTGWSAYASAALILAGAHVLPYVAFRSGIILPYLATLFAAWLSTVGAAAWQYFVIRRQLLRTESDKQRYQQAIHFVTHEMRSPLTAIQGSSELMGRYALTEEKRKQMAQMINNESKRLAKMIQTFLDIERLTDGQMEIKQEPFDLHEVLETSVSRARTLADRKNIRIELDSAEHARNVRGDRELMEYAVYNLLTNAVKYSPADTLVWTAVQVNGSEVRVIVKDQGMGMEEKELRNIGRKFYRTRTAEASGEAGTGIGLSLVQQIVVHHHGRMEVQSKPGAGSCFTMVLPFVSG